MVYKIVILILCSFWEQIVLIQIIIIIQTALKFHISFGYKFTIFLSNDFILNLICQKKEGIDFVVSLISRLVLVFFYFF